MKLQAESLTNLNAGSIVDDVASAIRGGDCAIDFSLVRRCDTAAVACVLAWTRIAQAGGRTLALTGVPRDLVSLAKLYGVDHLVGAAGRA